MNWHNFENKRILGTVPVEADGSAYFEVPSDRYVFFQLLDKDKRMIQSMRSGTIIQSGETQGCVGCHENRTGSAAAGRWHAGDAQAAARSTAGSGRRASFPFSTKSSRCSTAIACAATISANRENGGLVLAGDRELVFNAAYTELWSKGMVRCDRRRAGRDPARASWGLAASRLIEVLDRGHYEVELRARGNGTPGHLDRPQRRPTIRCMKPRFRMARSGVRR